MFLVVYHLEFLYCQRVKPDGGSESMIMFGGTRTHADLFAKFDALSPSQALIEFRPNDTIFYAKFSIVMSCFC